MVEGIPGGIGRALGIVGPHALEAALAVKVQAVGAGVGIHAVQDDPQALAVGRLAQGREVLGGSQHGVGGLVVAGIVAVAGKALGDGVQVDHGCPQRRDIVQLLLDAPEVAAVKIVVENFAVLVRPPLHILPPGLVHRVGLQLSGEVRAAGFAEPVRENLIEHRALGPVGGVEVRRNTAQLPQVSRLHVGVVPLLEQTEAAVRRLHPEVVEEQSGMGDGEVPGEYVVGPPALRQIQRHGKGMGAAFIAEQAVYHGRAHAGGYMDVEGALLPGGQGSKGCLVLGELAVVENPHSLSPVVCSYRNYNRFPGKMEDDFSGI